MISRRNCTVTTARMRSPGGIHGAPAQAGIRCMVKQAGFRFGTTGHRARTTRSSHRVRRSAMKPSRERILVDTHAIE